MNRGLLALLFAAGCTEATHDGRPVADEEPDARDGDDEIEACSYVRTWNRQGGSSNPAAFWTERGYAAATTDDGEVVVLGRFLGLTAPGVFGDLTIPTTNTDWLPGFITKLDRAGNFLWAKKMVDGDLNGDGTIAAGGGRIAVANAMNVLNIIDGVQTNALPFPEGGPNVYGDVFLGVLDDAGSLQWTKTLGTNASSDYQRGVAIDGAGNITIAVLRLFLDQPDDVQVIRFDVEGNLVWEWISSSTIYELVGTSDGDVVVAGAIATAEGSALVARLDGDTGEMTWSAGDPSLTPWPWNVAAGPNGEVAIAGTYDAPIEIDGVVLEHAGGEDTYVASWAADGTLAWAHAIAGTNNDWVQTLAMDSRGGTIAGLQFTGTTVAGELELASAGGADNALVFFDAGGTAVDIEPVGRGAGWSLIYDATVSHDDELFAIGSWRAETELGTPSGADDMFVTRMRCGDSAAPLSLKDVTATVRSGSMDRTEYFCAQSSDTWNNCKAVHLIGATGSTYTYPGASYDGHLMVGHTFGTVAPEPYTVQMDYVDADGMTDRMTVYFPAFSTAANNGKMLFYVADDGSTYYADPEHDGYRFGDEVLTPEQAFVPEHLARAKD